MKKVVLTLFVAILAFNGQMSTASASGNYTDVDAANTPDGGAIFRWMGMGGWEYVDNLHVSHYLGNTGSYKSININGNTMFIFSTGNYSNRKSGPYTGAFLVDGHGKAIIVDADSISPVKDKFMGHLLRVKNNAKGTAYFNSKGEMIIPYIKEEHWIEPYWWKSDYLLVKVEKKDGSYRFGLFAKGSYMHGEIVPITCHTEPRPNEWVKSDDGLIFFDGIKIVRVLKY